MTKTIITISREVGSGGHTIGKMLAERLGYHFYDEEIVDCIAKETGLSSETIEITGEFMPEQDMLEKTTGLLLYSLFSRTEKVPYKEIYEKQVKMIKGIVEKGNCVIVGRCADDILKDDERAFHVFVHSNIEHRIARVQRHDGITNQESRIRKELETKDKAKAAYYNFFTGKEWGQVTNYNMSLDTGIFTKTQCCNIIMETLEKLNGGNE